ncbi:MAG: hypothetical protein IH973_03035, partial [Myxococcales bacterium]|nr:hypothetical protein [Myxococcales bacterium]
MRSAKDFFQPLALGAPTPLREIPLRPSRMIHFFDPSNPKMVDKVPQIARKCDVLLGNLEDAIKLEKKEAAREGLIQIASNTDLGSCQLWTRINSLDSPWMLDDITRLVLEIEGRYTAFGVHETALLGLLCQASGVATKAARCRQLAGPRPIISFGARRIHPSLAPMIERSAYVGGCDGVAGIQSAQLIGEEPTGTMPHSLVLLLGGVVPAIQAFFPIGGLGD